MRKAFICILLSMICIAGCGKTIAYSGKSEHWQGNYRGVPTEDTTAGEFIFEYVNAPADFVMDSLSITLNDRALEVEREEHQGAIVVVPSTCSWCTASKPIEVVIKWNEKHEETFLMELD